MGAGGGEPAAVNGVWGVIRSSSGAGARRGTGGRGEAGVAGVAEKLLLEEPPPAEEPRADGADGDAGHRRGLLVRLPLDVHEDDGDAERVGELGEGAVD